MSEFSSSNLIHGSLSSLSVFTILNAGEATYEAILTNPVTSTGLAVSANVRLQLQATEDSGISTGAAKEKAKQDRG